jgi:hypothetical protein
MLQQVIFLYFISLFLLLHELLSNASIAKLQSLPLIGKKGIPIGCCMKHLRLFQHEFVFLRISWDQMMLFLSYISRCCKR